jgi:hypothetical protein
MPFQEKFIMSDSLADLLDEKFSALNIDVSSGPRAAHLKIDRGTYSKLVNGQMPFTEKRAKDFAKLLAAESVSADALAVEILELSKSAAPAPSVGDFFQSIVDSGGSMPAVEIPKLFKALTAGNVRNALFCIEYRDLPRTSRTAKYGDIGIDMGKAIADGMTVAMFVPFGIPDNSESAGVGLTKEAPSQNTLDYMRRVRDECRDLYHLLLEEATKAKNIDKDKFIKSGMLRLYERNPDMPYLGSGLGAKTGYIQYENDESGLNVRRQRVIQWLSTPRQDLVVYRGESQISYDAIRDSLYPIPHYFYLQSRDLYEPLLPSSIKQNLSEFIDDEVFDKIKAGWSDHNIPSGQHKYWKVYNGI